MDREFPQFGKVRVIQRLVAEGRITDDRVYAAGTQQAVLKAGIEVFCFGIEITGDG